MNTGFSSSIRTQVILSAFALISICSPRVVDAQIMGWRLSPADDGSIYSSGAIITNGYLSVSASKRGVIEFSLPAVDATVDQALLTVSPYATPVSSNPLEIYGYQDYDGYVGSDDYDAGILIGNWSLPINLGFGQDASFDVTDFMKGVSSPYVGFNLRLPQGGADVLCSNEYYYQPYGHPSQLIVSYVPEPGIWIYLVSFFILCAASL
jgi:hypothetical protein